jgi:hypothetical protein
MPPVTFSTDPSVSSDDLGRQSKPARKGLAHSPWIKEAGLTRDEISGVATWGHRRICSKNVRSLELDMNTRLPLQ